MGENTRNMSRIIITVNVQLNAKQRTARRSKVE